MEWLLMMIDDNYEGDGSTITLTRGQPQTCSLQMKVHTAGCWSNRGTLAFSCTCQAGPVAAQHARWKRNMRVLRYTFKQNTWLSVVVPLCSLCFWGQKNHEVAALVTIAYYPLLANFAYPIACWTFTHSRGVIVGTRPCGPHLPPCTDLRSSRSLPSPVDLCGWGDPWQPYKVGPPITSHNHGECHHLLRGHISKYFHPRKLSHESSGRPWPQL